MKINLPLLLIMSCFLTGVGAKEVTVSAPTVTGSPLNNIDFSVKRIELSLADAVWLGLRNNSAIRIQYLERVVQKFDLQLASDTFNPQWTLRASYQQLKNNQGVEQRGTTGPEATLLTEYGTQLRLSWLQQFDQHNQQGRKRNDGLDFSVIQPLLRGAGREIKTLPLEHSKISEQINRLMLKSTVTQAISNIILAYHDLLSMQERAKIASIALERAYEQFDTNKALIEAGRMAAMELLQSESQIASQQLELEETRNAVWNSEQTLLRLMGITPQSRISASDKLKVRHTALSLQDALGMAENQEPQYLAVLLGGKQAALDVLSARDEQRWSLSLKMGTKHQRDYVPRTPHQQSWEHYVGLELEVPLSNLAARKQLLEAQISVKQHQIELNEARYDLQQRIQQGLRELESRWKQYQLASRAVELSEKTLQLEYEKLRAGRSSNFQVISFEGNLKDAEYSRLNALIGYLAAQTELDMAMGKTLDTWKVALND